MANGAGYYAGAVPLPVGRDGARVGPAGRPDKDLNRGGEAFETDGRDLIPSRRWTGRMGSRGGQVPPRGGFEFGGSADQPGDK